MNLFSRNNKSSKPEGVPFEEIKRLQRTLQQGENLISSMKESCEALISQVDSQTMTVEKLQQELRVAAVQTTQTGESFNKVEPNTTKDRNGSNICATGRQGRKQQAGAITQGGREQEIEDSGTNVDACHKRYRQDLYEDADDLISRLLHNNQSVLLSQAKAIKGMVQANSHWFQHLQEDVRFLLPPISESSSSESDKKLIEKYKAIESDKVLLTKKCEYLGEEKKTLQREMEQLKKKYDSLHKENGVLKDKLTKFNPSRSGAWPHWEQPAPPKIQVRSQLYCPRKTDLTDSVITELTSMLKCKMDLFSLELNTINCESPTQINRSLPLIVICLFASRLGTDVSNALQKVPVGPNVAVLVLHHKDIHALPAQTSDKILTGDEYRNIGAIIDMAFLSQKGVYTCNMNDRGLDDLTNFIKSHSNK